MKSAFTEAGASIELKGFLPAAGAAQRILSCSAAERNGMSVRGRIGGALRAEVVGNRRRRWSLKEGLLFFVCFVFQAFSKAGGPRPALWTSESYTAGSSPPSTLNAEPRPRAPCAGR
jgi:hypothetical protein